MRNGQLEFTDAPMFSRVMADESICRRVLEAILGIDIERIEYSHIEHVIEPRLASRGIRADVYVKSSNAVYDIEMQTVGDFDMGKRLRYYQGAMDVGMLQKGDPYDALPRSIIIFICTYDPYQRGLPVYELDVLCRDALSIEVGHDFKWIILNAKAFARLQKGPLHDLLEYVAEGTVERPCSLTADIKSAVASANADERWRRENMDVYTWQEDLASKDKWLRGMQERLAGEEKRLAVKEESLAAQEEGLISKEESLAAQEENLSVKEERLAAENERLMVQQGALAEQEESLSARADSLAAQEESLSSMEESLASMEESLASKEERLAVQKEELAAREEALAAREAALAAKARELGLDDLG
ncbi:Rpn family recombination-promoting nuclease/putative transposase [Adlercreutzia equolifaciens]|uniref:Rpn family recombination-promoting nuclease/putative transposase n=1 Tax=Adlercreutzia equolifaciens TaxID=446660 RepID=UPI0023B16FD9|nr:Rpn family recombination-promoting nuclease/putative transposase [Adlercreutzia equolifaciens]MDE8701645.1 Rpn family recombination-promoting nuclease/putative transposase [Adlercreutzia equolifaciens]